jgi:Ca2+-binding EF-hand superfamily protein
MLNLAGIMVLFTVLFSSSDLFAQPQDVQVVVSEFKQIDANQDGFIVPEEMQAYQAQAFKKLDKDGNYDLDSKELESDATGMHKLADSDQDGKITHRESSLKFNEYFEQMDKNQDGKISEAEYTDYWKLIYKF